MTDLRREIHSAYDVITPPVGGMPERVVQTVLVDKKRRRKEEMATRLRMPLSLVAALLLVAVVAAALVTWNALHNNVAPAGHVGLTTVQQLEAVPLHIPTYTDREACKPGPFNAAGDLGGGPIYGIGGATTSTAWGVYYNNTAWAQTATSGPILIRAIDVITGRPVVFVGMFAAGPSVGTDTLDGKVVQQRTELVFDVSQATKNHVGHPYEWTFFAGVPNDWSTQTGWQIDGLGFSEVFVAC